MDRKLDLVAYDDPILYEPSKPFDFFDPPHDPVQLVRDMATTMAASGGIGLSACQVGIPYRVFIMNSSPITACFNPRVTAAIGDDEETMEEGCLSFPGFVMKVRRAKRVRVTYNDEFGQHHTRVFVDMTARVFQHEMCHIDGKSFFAGASRLRLRMASDRSRKKFRKTYEINRLVERAEEHVA